ncbi:MAG: methyltransferase domain-containing protein [Sulfurimonas sp.]|nr:methyltransferase domain-containing protein [Sulfurimonas sp.]
MTLRRYYLDQKLSSFPFTGKVLDVGGNRKRRGTFRIPYADVERWDLVNIDPTVEPDYCCSAEAIPVDTCSYDYVVLTEVLEHLEHPECVLKECFRVLKQDGTILVSMPFLFPVHADPYDYQRWTADKLYLTLRNCGFSNILVEPMGNLIAVMHDLLHVALISSSCNTRSLSNRVLKRLLLPPLFWIGQRKKGIDYRKQVITTGWFVTASK